MATRVATFTFSDICPCSLLEKVEFFLLGKAEQCQPAAVPKSPAPMRSPEANLWKPPRKVFVIQLEEARAERKRRRYENNSAGEIACVEDGLSHLADKKANNDGLS
jgi:hypothetical protein